MPFSAKDEINKERGLVDILRPEAPSFRTPKLKSFLRNMIQAEAKDVHGLEGIKRSSSGFSRIGRHLSAAVLLKNVP
ncbi:uncharacterized protein LOC111402999 isoform X1 [Olea europaea var. sylvestris]|uniref:uncharacterized protein LOC111402999 isoform X1 n=1 Tax=Olea europaea var. sylvestris TaxID=158386 RepID=UPI000C1D51B4|nr:uncharacterized protein LOC111402999 isoform X1 [Olea europaea var. sylvestris]